MSRLTSGLKRFALLAVMVTLPAAAQSMQKPMDVEKLNDNISQHTGKKVGRSPWSSWSASWIGT